MFRVLVLVLALGAHNVAAWLGTKTVGTSCDTNADCRGVLYPYLETIECEQEKCECAEGYYGAEGEICRAVTIGTPCEDGDDGDTFCRHGVANSQCDSDSLTCFCPAGTVFTYQFPSPPLNPACVEPILPSDDDACETCHASSGVCYASSGEEPDSCGCPACVGTSDMNSPLLSGCDTFYAYPGESCKSDQRELVCLYSNLDPVWGVEAVAACLHDGTLEMTYTCQCLDGYVQVPDPYDPTKTMCAKVITKSTDEDCEVCEQNDGICYDVDQDDAMDGCSCPVTRSSPGPAPDQACSVLHVTIECTSDSMILCFEKEQYDSYIGRKITNIYAEGQESNSNCHLSPVDNDNNEWCLTVLHDACGVQAVDSKHWKSYSIWFLFQYDKYVQSSADLCIYAYCSYDKLAQVSTGLVDVATKKIRYSTGVTLKPVVEMTINNKFNDDCEEVGTRLGEQVKLQLRIDDTRGGVFTSLSAVTCVASNMMSLNHPNAQSAVFLLDGCPTTDGQISPPPAFLPLATDPLVVTSTFFSMPKFSGDIVFFHCAVRVCTDSNDDECDPANCAGSRRKRNALESRVERSTHDLMAQLESPDYTQKVVALKVTDPNSRKQLGSLPATSSQADNKMIEMERILNKIVERESKAKKTAVRSEPMSSSMLVAAIIGSSLVTVVIGAILILFWTRQRAGRGASDKVMA